MIVLVTIRREGQIVTSGARQDMTCDVGLRIVWGEGRFEGGRWNYQLGLALNLKHRQHQLPGEVANGSDHSALAKQTFVFYAICVLLRLLK